MIKLCSKHHLVRTVHTEHSIDSTLSLTVSLSGEAPLQTSNSTTESH